ncbi:BON domain-containing protein [Solimonas terrae]|uniref:BON domain-containing protein n=1 Tax=Solimonas terrae TaxID=1396819 RepID=A0A6M2BL19_9GAMM|nr:BON domain-containing protein [Solimonas terrae]NGY03204.1 BON domain-containing protein [Solimonas terrae]
MKLDDRKLQQNVLAALGTRTDLDASVLGVAVRDGVVTLSGHVHHHRDKLAAAMTARGVPGVRAIAQQIDVRPADLPKTADDEIADRAARLLAWDLMVSPGTVHVTVEHGVVELAGTVEWEHQRRDAERDVRKLQGVREVINHIGLLKPADAVDREPRPLHEFVAVRVLAEHGAATAAGDRR